MKTFILLALISCSHHEVRTANLPKKKTLKVKPLEIVKTQKFNFIDYINNLHPDDVITCKDKDDTYELQFDGENVASISTCFADGHTQYMHYKTKNSHLIIESSDLNLEDSSILAYKMEGSSKKIISLEQIIKTNDQALKKCIRDNSFNIKNKKKCSDKFSVDGNYTTFSTCVKEGLEDQCLRSIRFPYWQRDKMIVKVLKIMPNEEVEPTEEKHTYTWDKKLDRFIKK